jgi:hypothetical protein
LTLAIWIRPEVRRTQYVFIKTDGEDGFELSLSSSGRMFVRFNKETSGNDYRVDSDSTYPTNGTDWVHLAATYDGDTIRLYVDGELEASADGPSSVGTNNDPLGIGAGADGFRPLEGALDDARIYDRALSGAEIAALAGN